MHQLTQGPLRAALPDNRLSLLHGDHQPGRTTALQAEQVKAVGLRISQKYYGEPRRINARWQRRHGASDAPQQLEGARAGTTQVWNRDRTGSNSCWRVWPTEDKQAAPC